LFKGMIRMHQGTRPRPRRDRPHHGGSKLIKAKELSRQSTEIAKRYEPTPEDRAAIDVVCSRRIAAPRLKVAVVKGRAEISPDHVNPDYGHAQLMKAFGTGELDSFSEILSQLSNVSVREGTVNERELNFMVDVVKGIQPKDQLETMLAVQMAIVHSLTVDTACRLKGIFTLPQLDFTERALNKLARTFAAQMEALKRYRTAGEQKVTVEHVTVNDGGKAIVGNVMHGGAGASKTT
jgi:hypothetical protein